MRPLLGESLTVLLLEEVFLLEPCLLLKMPGELAGEENPHSRLDFQYFTEV